MKQGTQNTDIEIKQCSMDSTFLLKRITVALSSPSVEVDFSPLLHPSLPNAQSSTEPVLSQSFPVFNFDSHYYTPSFILEVDKPKYVKTVETYFELHERKKQEMSEQKSQLFLAKPSKGNSFCCVCKIPFEDYLTHVNVPKHHELMRASTFCQDIFEICKIFNQDIVEETQEKNKISKKKKIKKEVKAKRCSKKMANSLSTTMIQTTNLFESQKC